MASAAPLLPPRFVFYDALGAPLAGGFVYTYVPGTTTTKGTWQDAAEQTPNQNPVLLDTGGSCLLFGSGSYQLTVTDSLGNQVPAYSGVTTDLGTLGDINSSGNVVVAGSISGASLAISGAVSTGNVTVEGTVTTSNAISVVAQTNPGEGVVTLNPSGNIVLQMTGGAGFNFMTFESGSAVVGSITYTGTGNVAYNTASDYRLKTTFGPAAVELSTLPVYDAVYNVSPDAHRPMVLAHELALVAPYAVTGAKDAVDEDGKPVMQFVDHSALVPALLAYVQSLEKRVLALEALS